MWYDADERLRRLSNAMDSELKALAFDAYTWISRDGGGGSGGRRLYCRDYNVQACFVSCCFNDPRPEIYQINSTSTTTTTTTSGTTSCSAMNYSHCTSATGPGMSQEAEHHCRASLKKSEAHFLHLLTGIKWGLTPVLPCMKAANANAHFL